MIPFKQCPTCGGQMVQKDVEKLVRGGTDTAVLRVSAEVCLHCGERLYAEETVRKFEETREKLKRRDTAGLAPIGRSFQAV